MKRKKGEILEIERSILQALLSIERQGDSRAHGFRIAKAIGGPGETKRLTSHGTLYRALDRLQHWNLIEGCWEDPQAAADEGRPRRRYYCLTDAGRSIALQSEQSPADMRLRITGEAPA